MDIQSILKNLDKEVLTEETATAIAEAFNTAVEEKANAKIQLEVENAVSKLDEDHASKLKNLLEAIDEDHTSKLKLVVDTINEDHTGKLESLVKHYRQSINEKAESFSNKVVEELSSYLDLYIDKSLPKQQLEEAVHNTYARQQLDKIKEILAIDPAVVNESIKQTIVAGKNKVDEVQSQLNESYNENLKLTAKLNQLEAAVLLEKKTNGMPRSKKEYLIKILSDKAPQYIEENFNYVVEMFEREETEQATKLVEEAKTKAVSKDARPTVVTESTKSTEKPVDSPVYSYLSELKRS
jgi:hypothetical protein